MNKDSRVRSAKSVAKPAKLLARRAAQVEHREEAAAHDIVGSQAAADIMAMIAPTNQPQNSTSRKALPALLIINSKSGPKHDSLLHVGELVDLLAGHGIAAEVHVKVHASQARREASAAAKAGYALVIAAGGDGTIEAIAGGLVGSKTVLGVIPLGTYNNIATSLGIPKDLAQACALIAAAPVRAIDVGQVRARGMKRPRLFFEVGAVGIAAPLALAGQGMEKGRWDAVARYLPGAVEMVPGHLGLRLDGRGPAQRARSLLAIVANTPRAGAGLLVVPQARVDDGLLDVRLYEEMSQVALAEHFVAVKGGTVGDDTRIHASSARKLVIRSGTPMPVVVDSRVVGSTPARFRVLSGALLVIAGRGDGLSRPAARALVSAVLHDNMATRPHTAVVEVSGNGATSAPEQGLQLAKRSGPLGVALAVGAAVAIMPALSRWIDRRRHRHPHGRFLARLLP
jgi:diacylglycerol kinase (ATP)